MYIHFEHFDCTLCIADSNLEICSIISECDQMVHQFHAPNAQVLNPDPQDLHPLSETKYLKTSTRNHETSYPIIANRWTLISRPETLDFQSWTASP